MSSRRGRLKAGTRIKMNDGTAWAGHQFGTITGVAWEDLNGIEYMVRLDNFKHYLDDIDDLDYHSFPTSYFTVLEELDMFEEVRDG